MRTTGVTPEEKCILLLDSVKERVRTDAKMFDSFVEIFSCEAALSDYAEYMTSTRGMFIFAFEAVYVYAVYWRFKPCYTTKSYRLKSGLNSSSVPIRVEQKSDSATCSTTRSNRGRTKS